MSMQNLAWDFREYQVTVPRTYSYGYDKLESGRVVALRGYLTLARSRI